MAIRHYTDERIDGFAGEKPGHRERNPRWETRKLLEIGDTAKKRATVVWTPSFPEPRPFYVQAFFAATVSSADGTTLNPALPFEAFSTSRILITVQRYIDDYGGVLEDSYVINGSSPTPEEPAWLPISIVTARKLVITAEIIDTAPGHGTQFVDISVSLVETIDTEQIIQSRYAPSANGSGTFLPNIFGFGDVPQIVRVAQNVAAVQLLPPDQTRRQFWITNEGTARLAIRFSTNDPDVTAGAQKWDVILDAKGGAVTRYESPLNAYWGEVRGIWEGAGAGFALASGAIIE
jgi:hypothetical protein